MSANPTWVDSHCHLDFPDFADEREAIISRARQAGVATLLTICTKVTEFAPILKIAEADPNIWCSYGIHPHEAEPQPDTSVETLIQMTKHPKIVALGECGLDYHYMPPSDRQIQVFRTHAIAAREAGVPLVVHTREADDDTARLLSEESDNGKLTGVLHCFTSGIDLALKGVELGFYVSFSGIVTFKNAEAIRDIVRAVPMDRILVETDAPFLAPVPKRGKRNEPAFVVYTAETVAAIKGISSNELAVATTANFHRLFSKTTETQR